MRVGTGVRRTVAAVAAATVAFGAFGVLGLGGPRDSAYAASSSATLTVQKGGDRVSPDAVSRLSGATFDFFAGTEGNPPGSGATPTASCVTGTIGRCSVDVPERTGNGQGYWVVERSAPSGWSVINNFDTGSVNATTTPTVYNRYFTGKVRHGQTYTIPEVSSGNENRTARGSQWVDRRDNPPLPNKCGLNIGLLLDVSTSISPYLSDVKAAANGFVDALTGTPSTIGLATFANDAQTVLPPTPVAATAGATSVKTAINGLTSGGSTNWAAGLFEMTSATPAFDVVLMLTDGSPTLYGSAPPSGPGYFTRFREVEEGVFSANALKAEGTRVVAVGVGVGVSGAANNLQAVSGPVSGSDYVQTDYAALAQQFRKIALASCSGTVSVVKLAIPPGGTAADALPVPGWTFTTATSGVTPASGVTSDSGAVNFAVDLAGSTTRPVTLSETLQSGYTLEQQSGFNAACSANGQPITVTNSGALGFTVNADASAIVTCTVLNRAPMPLAAVVVNKTWVINGTRYDNPTQPVQFEAFLDLTGQEEANWGVTYSGYRAGDSVTVGETLDEVLLPSGCTNTPSGDLGQHTLVAGVNTFEVTDTLTCLTTLQLVKLVENPYGEAAPASAWTLTAYQGTTPVFSGTDGVSQNVTPATVYTLGESIVPGYTQTVAEGATIPPPATGSWACSVRERSGLHNANVFDGTNGQVILSIGTYVVCIATNIADPAHLTLRKSVTNQFGGAAARTDWLLRADTATAGGSIVGRHGQAGVTAVQADPGTTYALSEADGPAGYASDGVTCVLTGTTTVVPTPDNKLTPDLGQHITCTFANHDIQPRLTLVKDVRGGSAAPNAWTLTATGRRQSISGAAGTAAVTDAGVSAGTYRLSETGGPKNYRTLAPTCVLSATGRKVTVTDRAVRLAIGQDVTCVFANQYVPPLPVTGTSGLPELAAVGALCVLLGAVLVLVGRRRYGRGTVGGA